MSARDLTPIGVLPLSKKLIYGIPRFTIRASFIVIGIYSNLFYLSLGADIRLMAFFVAAGRSLDVLTDPLMGWLSDKHKSSWGRRKPFLLPGMIVYNICQILFWNPPKNLGENVTYWFAATYILFFAADTFTSVPYYALGAELTDDPKERNSVYFWQNLFGQVGTLVGMGLPAMLTNFLSDDAAFRVVGIVFSTVHLFGMSLILKYIDERPPSDVRIPPFAVNFLRVLTNQAFQPILKSWFLDWGSLGLLSSMFPFYVQYILIEPSGTTSEDTVKSFFILGICSMALFIAALMSMPVWLWLGERLGKRNAWLLYNVWNSVTCPWFLFLDRGDYTMAVLISALNGTAVGGQFFVDSVLADCIDYDEFLHGNRLEGAFSSVTTFIPKIILVATTALPLAGIAAVGYVPTIDDAICLASSADAVCDKMPQPQPETVKTFVKILFCAVPSLLTAISCVVKLSYPIKNAVIMKQISDGIILHANGHDAVDPVTGKTVGVVSTELDAERKLWAMLHFSKTSLVKYSKDGSAGLIRRMAVEAAVSMVATLATIIITLSTFHFIEEDRWAWVPTLSCVFFGGSFTFAAFTLMRLRVALTLDKQEIPLSLLNTHVNRIRFDYGDEGGVDQGKSIAEEPITTLGTENKCDRRGTRLLV
jgi:GPH family glycoside/pentoside/hexuronide:cation symporter